MTTATMLERSKPYASVEHVKIYWIKAQAPRRVLALVKYLGLEAEFVEVDMMGGGFKKPNYVALNPNMKAPTLVDGDLVLWESSAIMAHLCIKAGSNMWPANTPAEQVQVLLGCLGTIITGRLQSLHSIWSTSSRLHSESGLPTATP